MKTRSLPSLLLALACVLLVGCSSGEPNDDNSLMSGAEKLWRDAKQKVQGYAPQTDEMSAAAQKQFQDMFRLEYRVVELDNSANAQKIQDTLAQLGNERWECFNILERGDSLVIPCRRRPISLLRYALRYLPFP